MNTVEDGQIHSPAVAAALELADSARGSGDVGVLARAVEELDERVRVMEYLLDSMLQVFEVVEARGDQA